MKSNVGDKVSTFSQVLLWFGAAVSIAEILTGAFIAPLGLTKGIFAILLGHVIGAIILFLAGLIGAKSGLSAAWSVRISFGKYGSYVFSIINILQLLGWTAIMIISAAKALNGITGQLWNFTNESLWCVVIGLLVSIWVMIGNKEMVKLNTVVMFLLLGFSLVLGAVVFKNTNTAHKITETMYFGTAVELNVAMSLSWLPLISDYTRKLQKPVSGTLGSVLGYFAGSVLMYVIGLGAAIFTGTSDIGEILLVAGLGIIALFIVLLATVTTTFLDVYSAGVSIENINKNAQEKVSAVIVCLVGTLLAIFVSMDQYENFLYLIGSLFAPLFAILFTDYYIIGNKTVAPQKMLNVKNAILWIIGFIFYRFFMPYATFLGVTLPVMIMICLICAVTNLRKVNGKWVIRYFC